MPRAPTPSLPSEEEARLARESRRPIAALISRGKATRILVSIGNQEVAVPCSALRLFVDVLAEMAEGNAVTITPIHAEMTTQEAADFLNVSRPYLVGLLEKGQIPFRKVGSHRRALFTDLQAYREKSLAERRAAMVALAKETKKLGLGY